MFDQIEGSVQLLWQQGCILPPPEHCHTFWKDTQKSSKRRNVCMSRGYIYKKKSVIICSQPPCRKMYRVSPLRSPPSFSSPHPSIAKCLNQSDFLAFPIAATKDKFRRSIFMRLWPVRFHIAAGLVN